MTWTLIQGNTNGTPNIYGGFRWQLDPTYGVNGQDIATNTSRIIVQMYMGRAGSDWNLYNLSTLTSTIQYDSETSELIGTRFDLRNATPGLNYFVGVDTSVFPVGSYSTKVLTHNTDGTKSVLVRTMFAGDVLPYLDNISTSATITLPTIPRTSQPTLDVSSKDIGGTFTITTNRASSSFTHKLYYSFGAIANTLIASDVGSSTTWVVPTSLGSQLPTANSGSGTFTCETYSGSTLIGTSTIPFTLTIPASWRAVLTTAHSGFTWINSPAQLTGYTIQNISTLALTLAAALNTLVSAYGTTITGYQVRFDTYNSGEVAYSNSSISKSAGVILVSGTQYAYFKVKDARGNWSNEVQEQIMGTGSTIYTYGAPADTGFNVSRNSTTPTTADFQMNFSRSSINNANTWSYQRQYDSGVSWENIDSSPVNITTDTISSLLADIGTPPSRYAEDSIYSLRVKLVDLFSTVYYNDTLPTSAVPFAMTNKGAGAGKVPTNDTYDFEVGVRGIGSDGVVKGTQLQSSIATGTPPATVTSTTKVTNLNVDQLDNLHAANTTGAIPISNGTVNTNLNADMLDGLHVASAATVSTVMARDSSGYSKSVHHNLSRANEASAAASYVYDTGDGYLRKKTLLNAQSEIGGALAWVVFNSGGGIFASKGVSSVTYNGVGVLTINFSPALPDANYAWAGSLTKDNDNVSSIINVFKLASGAHTSTALTIVTSYRDGGAGYFNSPQISVVVFR